MYSNNLFFQYENGTTGIKNLDLKSFLSNNFVTFPDMSSVKKFNAINENILQIIFNLSEENINLSNIRDNLMPKLLSGEIKVPVLEAERV